MASPSRKRPVSQPKPSVTKDLQRDARLVLRLSDWFEKEHRPLPFRQGKNAYRTWVSEVMLQQTQVKTVVPYFERWMEKFPTVKALAKAGQAEVLAAWQGLGYYSRGRNLHLAAQRIVAEFHGKVPSDVAELLSLPGIGRYTAGAIASIAFDKPAPIVDGNVIRVLTRVDGLRGDPRKPPLAEALWSRAESLVQLGKPATFNQGLMELGALVCTPKSPRCPLCPLASDCVGMALGLVDKLPELPQRRKPEVRRVVVLLSEKSGRIFLREQPPDSPHWAHLHALPYVETTGASAEHRRRDALDQLKRISPKIELTSSTPIATFHYPITRFRFEAEVYKARGLSASIPGGRYVAQAELDSVALPSPHRRLLTTLAKPSRN